MGATFDFGVYGLVLQSGTLFCGNERSEQGVKSVHQAFYRKWRPQTFDDVYGQEHITSVLRYEAEHGTFSHAYLFCGSRGTGKTTCAKILAKVVNCEHPVNGSPCGQCDACRLIESGAATDILEMDAASNNGVDNIRDIRDEVAYAPSLLKYRVYIIDEVHMLSTSAFNALLKTLEEPPEHVVFILATTELQKLPATIISRCQRFDFRRISTENLMKRLTYIAEQEKLTLDPEAARMLARLAQGGMRDAISLLELCAGSNRNITPDVVNECVGVAGKDSMFRTVEAIANADYDALFAQIDEVVRSSKDIAVFWQDLIAIYRDMLVVKTTSSAANYLDLTDHETKKINEAAARFRKETLLYHCKLLEDAFFAMQRANAVKRIVAELALVRMCDESLDSSGEALLSRVAKLEDRVAVGGQTAFQKAESPIEEAPKPIREAIPERAAEETTVQRKNPEAQPAKRVLKPFRQWMEVVERISVSNQMIAGFFRTVKAFTTENGQILLRFDSDFTRDMALREGGKETLRGALSTVLRQDIPEDRIRTEVGTNSEKNVLDEIIEATDEENLTLF